MKKEDIHWADWHRILIGDAPTEFLLEVLLRTLLIYFVLIMCLRLMGKRMGGQLTISELAVMLTLGAIICVTMQLPDKGLLTGIVVLLSALWFQRGITFLGVKNAKIEQVLQGKEVILVKDGIIQVDQLAKESISRQQLYAVLRSQQIFNLGEVERVYLEACGLFSVYKFESPRNGLPIFPPIDTTIQSNQAHSTTVKICKVCGQETAMTTTTCTNCKHKF